MFKPSVWKNTAKLNFSWGKDFVLGATKTMTELKEIVCVRVCVCGGGCIVLL